MRVRHRTPSIFNISMVDVLCCALGCVILLWLMGLRIAREQDDSNAAQKRAAEAELENTQAARDTVAEGLRRVRAERDEANGRYYALQTELADLVQTRDDLQEKVAALADRLAKSDRLGKTQTTQAGALAQKLEVATSQLKELQALADRVPDLSRRLRAADQQVKDLKATASLVPGLRDDLNAAKQRTKDLKVMADLVPGLRDDVRAADQRIKDLKAVADLVPGLRDDLKKAEGQYAAAADSVQALRKQVAQRAEEMKAVVKQVEALNTARTTLEREANARGKELTTALAYRERAEALEKEVADSKKRLTLALRSVATLEGDKKQLQGEVGRMKTVVDNRFAGITLTGQRVVFLVDMSGSMKDVDEKTPAPDKWKEVAGTVSKLMKSLPDLKKYQVILFAEQTTYPLGGSAGWLSFDADTTPEKVEKALTAVKPDGGTNMFAALRAAFRLRDDGLDTIYLLSDGLPNEGEPLSAEEAATRKESERNEILGRHIRKTLKENWNRVLDNRPRVKINAIGFFYESPEVGAFLWAMARENDGSFVGMSKP